MKKEEIDLTLPDSEKIYVTAPDSDVRVGMRKLSLQNGESMILYDTTGAYTDPDIDTSDGLPEIKKGWIEEREKSADGLDRKSVV